VLRLQAAVFFLLGLFTFGWTVYEHHTQKQERAGLEAQIESLQREVNSNSKLIMDLTVSNLALWEDQVRNSTMLTDLTIDKLRHVNH
jgi:hypothetical protein